MSIHTTTKGMIMRMTRTLAALVAVVASLALAFTMAPATAERPTSDDGASIAGPFGKFRPHLNKKNTRVIASGQANNWKRKPVQIHRAPKGTKKWTLVATVKTKKNGKFRVALVPGSDIPCNGKQFVLRAKKKGRPSAKIYKKKTFYCA